MDVNTDRFQLFLQNSFSPALRIHHPIPTFLHSVMTPLHPLSGIVPNRLRSISRYLFSNNRRSMTDTHQSTVVSPEYRPNSYSTLLNFPKSKNDNRSRSVRVIYNSIGRSTRPNAIAFDLDETIGSFSDFYSIWARLEEDMKTQSTFNALMDLYPEFLRVGIIPILRYIRTKQQSGQCLPIYLYTNNQCEDTSWIYKLINYLEYRVSGIENTNNNIFARPICAFEINGKRIEPERTTKHKTYSDFVKCSMLTTSHQICFLDDVCHKKMKHRRVYYIQPPPYIHPLSYQEVVDRFTMSSLFSKLYPDREQYRTYSANRLVQEDIPRLLSTHGTEENKIANKMMYYIREFFLITSRGYMTRKSRQCIGNFTRKKRGGGR